MSSRSPSDYQRSPHMRCPHEWNHHGWADRHRLGDAHDSPVVLGGMESLGDAGTASGRDHEIAEGLGARVANPGQGICLWAGRSFDRQWWESSSFTGRTTATR